MKKKKKSSIFAPYLKDDEEIIWHGRAITSENLEDKKHNNAHLRRYFSRLSETIIQDKIKAIFVLAWLFLVTGGCIFHPVWLLLLLDPNSENYLFFTAGMMFWLIPVLITLFYFAPNGENTYETFTNIHETLSKNLKALLSPLKFQYSYAITNQRILILENQKFINTTFSSMEGIEVSKVLDGLYHIYIYGSPVIYSSRKPIATLLHLSEEDANIAEKLLLHAKDSLRDTKDEVLEKRLKEMAKEYELLSKSKRADINASS